MTERDEPLVEGMKIDARNYMRHNPRVWHEALEEAIDKYLPPLIEAVRAEERENAARVAEKSRGELSRAVAALNEQIDRIEMLNRNYVGVPRSLVPGVIEDLRRCAAVIAAASRPASPATRETVTEEMVERAARAIRHTPWPLGTTQEHLHQLMARAALEAALTEGNAD